MSGKVFINYRRDDSIAVAGRLRDRLAQSIGAKNLFMDVDNIPAGVDFVGYLDSQVAACDLFLVIMGPNWLSTKDADGARRIDDAADFVAIEISAALKRNVRVIPVLIDGARMPRSEELPEALRPLVRRNAVEVRNTQFGRDAEMLIEKVQEALEITPSRRRRRPFLVSAIAATILVLVVAAGLYANGSLTGLKQAVGPAGPNSGATEAAVPLPTEAQRKAVAFEQAQKANAAQQRLTELAAAEAERQRAVESERKVAAAAKAELERKRAVELAATKESERHEAEKIEEERRRAAAADAAYKAATKADEERRRSLAAATAKAAAVVEEERKRRVVAEASALELAIVELERIRVASEVAVQKSAAEQSERRRREAETAKIVVTPQPDPEPAEELVRGLQLELRRAGCYAGTIDGKWGSGSRLALVRFSDQAGVNLATEKPTAVTLTEVTKKKGRICPCDSDEREVDGKCVVKPPVVAIPKEPSPVDKSTSKPTRAAASGACTTPPGKGGSCDQWLYYGMSCTDACGRICKRTPGATRSTC